MEEGQNSRWLHYFFAHKQLPKIAFKYPDLMLSDALNNELETKLRGLWQTLAQELEPGVKLPIEELNCQLVKLHKKTLVIVKMPNPEQAPEAAYVALLFTKKEKDSKKSQKSNTDQDSDLKLACYTLELSETDENGNNTYVKAGWGEDGMHYNFGAASGDLDEFIAWIDSSTLS